MPGVDPPSVNMQTSSPDDSGCGGTERETEGEHVHLSCCVLSTLHVMTSVCDSVVFYLVYTGLGVACCSIAMALLS